MAENASNPLSDESEDEIMVKFDGQIIVAEDQLVNLQII